MAAILQTTFFKCICLKENVWILIKISLKFEPKSPINISSIGSDNSLAPIRGQAIIWSNDGYITIRHSAPVS